MLAVFLLFLVTSVKGTTDCSASIYTPYPYDQEPRYVWTVGAVIEVSADFLCSDNRTQFQIFRLTIGHHFIAQAVVIGSELRCEVLTNVTFQTSCLQSRHGYYSINTIFMTNETYNNLSVKASIRRSEQQRMQSFRLSVKYCSVNDLPSDLAANTWKRNYVYNESIAVRCSFGYLLNKYTKEAFPETFGVSCGKYAQWRIPDYACITRCLSAIRTEFPGQPKPPRWAVGEPINATIIFSCNSSSALEHRLYIQRLNESSEIFLGSVAVGNNSIRCHNNEKATITCRRDSRDGSFSVNVTVFNSTVESNSSTITIYNTVNNRTEYQTPAFQLEYCSIFDLPGTLSFDNRTDIPFLYGNEMIGKCTTGDVFLDGVIYTESLKISCFTYARWKTPNYTCLASCPSPSHELLKISDDSLTAKKYKAGLKLELECKSGQLYFVHSASRFEKAVTTICEKSGKWKNEEVDCWTGDVANFTNVVITLKSGTPVIFSCEPEDSRNKVQMIIGQEFFPEQTSAWHNITVASKYHDVTAKCKEIDNSGKTMTRTTRIRVLFSPEVEEQKPNQKIGITPDSAGDFVVRFRAHPTLGLNDIQVTKDGKKIPNFYLVVEGVDHTIVVDFRQVERSDFGIYTVSLDLHRPFNGTTIHNFTVTESQAETQQLTTTGAVGVTLGAVLGLHLIAIAVFLTLKKLRNAAGNPSETNRTATEHEERDVHNYEEIKDGKVTTSRQSYANTAFETRNNRGSRVESGEMYEVPISGISGVPPAESVYKYDN